MKEVTEFQCEKCGRIYLSAIMCQDHEKHCNLIDKIQVNISWNEENSRWYLDTFTFKGEPHSPIIQRNGLNFTGTFNADVGHAKAFAMTEQNIRETLEAIIGRIDFDIPKLAEKQNEQH